MKKALFTIFIAAILWTIMFSPITAPYVNFWWMMTASACTLSLLATFFGRGWWKDLRIDLSNILLGIAIAVALWSVFWIGDKLSQLMFNFARPQVDIIYGMKDGESPLLLTLLMLFLIGPAEEIFWRGYIQKSFSQYWNPNVGMIVTTAIYSLVHAGSCNFMLTMAALVAGLAWGLMYRFFPEKFGAIIISHALWDVAVFIWFPI
ncbi:MAG: CPBP family intramembrane metalloprotease [Bacteroidaceae bacterium]|nr:CPBP family intramembrane metalloprotease [Bacteroidaceae bacterium]